jgi:hypothetical protein
MEGDIVSGNAPMVMRLLAEQRKRCLATILNSAESSPWWARLSDTQQNTYRDQVRTALAVFYDLSRDVVKVADDDDDGMRNGHAIELIRSFTTQQQRIIEQLKENPHGR